MIKFSKTELDKIRDLDKMIHELNTCTDKYCGNIVTSKELNKEGLTFLKNVTKKCRSNVIPKNEKELKLKYKKYDKCFTKYKKKSKYHQKLTQRKKCQDKNCSIYQQKIYQQKI